MRGLYTEMKIRELKGIPNIIADSKTIAEERSKIKEYIQYDSFPIILKNNQS